MTAAENYRRTTMSESKPKTQSFIASATAAQPQRFVISEADSLNDAQADGRWISSANPVDIKR